jgi:hypothetical protein
VCALRDDQALDLQRDAQPSLTPATPAGERAVEFEGFNLQAGVPIVAADALGRERLLRYGSRPALSVDRLRQQRLTSPLNRLPAVPAPAATR